jgi:hypothetical protein
MFLKETRENISVVPGRELSILLGFSVMGLDENPYGLSKFRSLRQNPLLGEGLSPDGRDFRLGEGSGAASPRVKPVPAGAGHARTQCFH